MTFSITKEANYLQKHHTQFIGDVSSAPSIIRKLFILPGLKDFKTYRTSFLDLTKVKR
ncbi:MAG: hypothetical protein Q9M40_13395 [Sulfurimonas sp.]|nr:hypothetical protein [Sulfurimonas sp.]